MDTVIIVIGTLALASSVFTVMLGFVVLNSITQSGKEVTKVLGLGPIIMRQVQLLERMDKLIHIMHSIMTDNGNVEEGDHNHGPETYRSADGRYSASSLEELIDKMSKDPRYKELDDDEGDDTWKKSIETDIEENDDDEDETTDEKPRGGKGK